jgi:hypothetical protein
MTEGSKGVLLATMLFFTLTATTAPGQDSPLEVAIKTSQAVVRSNRDFIVDATIRNISKEDQVLKTDGCHYGDWNWQTDNPAVRVQEQREIRCKENLLLYLRLKPGEVFKKVLSLRIAVPAGEVMEQSVIFRLGLELRLGYNLSTRSPPYTWSDPITIRLAQ